MSNLDDINIPIREIPRRMEITKKPSKKEIVVKQKWKFIFMDRHNYQVHVFGNTMQEVRDNLVIDYYFKKFRESILKIWNNKFQIIEKKTDGSIIKYNLVFEIETVSSDPHWEVYLYLHNKNQSLAGFEATSWSAGQIRLYLDSMNNQTRQRTIGKNHTVISRQINAAHEFGHTLANHTDEYIYNSTMSEYDFKRAAYNNLMNLGNELETKYIAYIVRQLSSYLARNVRFSAVKIQ